MCQHKLNLNLNLKLMIEMNSYWFRMPWVLIRDWVKLKGTKALTEGLKFKFKKNPSIIWISKFSISKQEKLNRHVLNSDLEIFRNKYFSGENIFNFMPGKTRQKLGYAFRVGLLFRLSNKADFWGYVNLYKELLSALFDKICLEYNLKLSRKKVHL